MKLLSAPLQGFTEAPWRHFHASLLAPSDGLPDAYSAPFARVEKGVVRRRDIADIASPLCANHTVVPQVIARDGAEFSTLVTAIAATGHTHIDLNMGCPFPPQVARGRGAGLLRRPDGLEQISDAMTGFATRGITFSVKMRLGVDLPSEWRVAIDLINAMPLTNVTVHPRVAAQQYSGAIHAGHLAELAGALVHPWIFNADILTPADLDRVAAAYPSAAGAMIGRGLLARPSLIAEWRSGCEWSRADRLELIMQLHSGIFAHCSSTLCGPSQILSKVKPFWQYLEAEIGRKSAKAIRKAGSMAAYAAAVEAIGRAGG